MIVKVSEEFQRYTNGLSSSVVEGETVKDCLLQVFNRYPQLYVYLMENKAEVAQRSIFCLNDSYLYEFSHCNLEVCEQDVLILTMEVPTGEKGALKYVGAAILIIVGVVLAIYGQEWGGPQLVALGWSMLIGGAVSALSTGLMDAFGPTLKAPDSGGSLDNSSAYTFNGVRNTTATGTPIQVVYGQFRVGGQYLNVYTRSMTISNVRDPNYSKDAPSSATEDWLYAQIGLCEGVIEGVSDVKINKLPLNYYNAINFVDGTGAIKSEFVRFGEATQSPMPKFNMTSNTTSVGRKVVAASSAPVADAIGYVDTPVHGYRIPGEPLPIYGYFLAVQAGVDPDHNGYIHYVPTDRDDPNAVILPYADRDKLRDGPPEMPDQVNKDGFTYDRNYERVTSATFQAATYTRILTSKEVNGFSITLTLPGLYKVGDNGYDWAEVSVIVLYRNTDDTSGKWSVATGTRGSLAVTISGKQRAEIVNTISIGISGRTASGTPYLPLAKYEVAVIRVTPDHTGWFKIVDDIYIKEITEYITGSLSYPYTAMLGVEIRATEQLSGSLPTISSVVKGTKVALPEMVGGLWTGNMTWNEETQTGEKFWSDNPCWCLYDLLTNTRYGLRYYYPIDPAKIGIMRANFFEMAKYCDEVILFMSEDGNFNYRKRFVLNIVIDQSKSAAEWIAAIAATMRATCFYSDGIFWIDIDRPKYVTQIFNMSNIKDYQETGTPYRSIPNCYEVQYPNLEQDYEIDSFRVETNELRTNPLLEERNKALTFSGVTDFDHAKGLTKYALVTGEYLTKVVNFKTGTDGVRCSVSDVVAIQHDVPATGWGGKILHVSPYLDTATLTLSTPFEYTHGMSGLNITVQKLDGSPSMTLPASAVDYGNAVDRISVNCRYSIDPLLVYEFSEGESYILSLATNALATFKVISIKRDADEMCEITAIQYDEQIFDLADDTSDLAPYVPPDTSNLQNPFRVSVRGVYASMKIYKDSAGIIKTGIEVFYQVPTNTFWAGVIVYWGLAGTFNYQSMPLDKTGSVFIPDIPTAGRYQIVVASVYKTGSQTLADALNDTMYRPYLFVDVTPYVPNDAFLAGVSGLEVVGSPDGSYYGKECKLQWRSPVVIDQYANSEATTTAAGNNTSSWLAYYFVQIKNTDGSLRRSSKVITESYTYSHEMNHEDGRPARTYDVQVTAVDRLGRESKPATLRVTNPPPAAIPMR